MKELTERQKANRAKKEALRIEQEINQKPVKSITFSIEWKKSRMWGYNPTLVAVIEFKDGTIERSREYKASGCGYDKESTVIAACLNDYMKYKLHAVSPQKKRFAPYGIYLKGRLASNPNHVSYNGGIGVERYRDIAKFIGGSFVKISSGKTFDVYKYEEK